MKDYIRSLFQKYRHKGILIDTNILLLLIVGTANRSRISKFNRTQQFIPEDYDILVPIINHCSKIVTTPNILTETYNLINQIGDPERSNCLSIFASFIDKDQMHENYLESKAITKVDNFVKFGLTDCGIIELARNQYLVLTDDLKLANYLQKLEIDTINFNNIRVYGWR